MIFPCGAPTNGILLCIGVSSIQAGTGGLSARAQRRVLRRRGWEDEGDGGGVAVALTFAVCRAPCLVFRASIGIFQWELNFDFWRKLVACAPNSAYGLNLLNFPKLAENDKAGSKACRIITRNVTFCFRSHQRIVIFLANIAFSPVWKRQLWMEYALLRRASKRER